MAASPETIQKTLRTFESAAEANFDVASRHGNVIQLGPETGRECMVTADLHGNRVNFDRLLMIANLEQRTDRHLVMQEVCHGGPIYPNGSGCMSHLMLEDVAALKVAFPDRFHFLLSNHEWAELMDFPIMKSNKLLNLTFRCGVQEMYGDRADEVRTAILRFVGSCPLAIRIAQKVVVCHSAPERIEELGFDVGIFERALSSADFAPHGDVFRLLWGRDFSAENAAAFAKLMDAHVLIHGHEPCRAGFQVPNPYQVILDCCGRHACYLILPTGESLTQQQVIDRIQSL